MPLAGLFLHACVHPRRCGSERTQGHCSHPSITLPARRVRGSPGGFFSSPPCQQGSHIGRTGARTLPEDRQVRKPSYSALLLFRGS